ncbi:MAG: hypothetical protein JWQ29_101, partial [Phenylobacterium sp.]|nr:hypothetical protein [Phenylobacterium sp.]
MIRVLVMIAVAGFLLCVATLGAAVAIGGPEALTRAAWSYSAGNHHWNFGRDDHGWGMHEHGRDDGPSKTRQIAWTGGDTLEVDVPAEVRYTQAPGPAKLTITGPERAVDDVTVEGGRIRYDHGRRHHRAGLVIEMTAPDVSRFDMHGASSLAIAGYRQARLRLDLSGNADATVAGETDVLELDISGSADADLDALKAKGAEVSISGSGEATLAPTDWAKIG